MISPAKISPFARIRERCVSIWQAFRRWARDLLHGIEGKGHESSVSGKSSSIVTPIQWVFGIATTAIVPCARFAPTFAWIPSTMSGFSFVMWWVFYIHAYRTDRTLLTSEHHRVTNKWLDIQANQLGFINTDVEKRALEPPDANRPMD